jgi:hypothetical protein
MNHINKPLVKLTEKWRETQISKIRDEKGDIATEANEIRGSFQYFENLISTNVKI